MAGRRRRGRTITIIFVAALIVLAALWAGYWYAARTVALTAIARLTATHTSGERVACTGLKLGGFPLYVDIHCDRSTFATGDGTATAAVGGIAVSAPLYRPGHAEAALDGPFVVDVPGRGLALTTNWSQAAADLTVGLGGVEAIGGSVAGLTAKSAAATPGLPVQDLSASSATLRLEPAAGNSFTLKGTATDLVLTLAAGRAFPTIDADAKLTALDIGGGLGGDPARAVLAWARKGGAVQIDKIKVSAAGAVVILSGKLSLSTDGLLNGSVLIQYNAIDKVADLIEAIRPGTRQHYARALEVLNGVTLPADTEDGPVRQTTLSFIQGSIWLGIIPLPVDPLPAIHL